MVAQSRLVNASARSLMTSLAGRGIALCRREAEHEGLAPRLFEQAMHALDLPRMYRTIYICDSFGIAGSAETLQRCYQHLAPGGALVFNVSLPYGEADRWNCWLPLKIAPSDTHGDHPST